MVLSTAQAHQWAKPLTPTCDDHTPQTSIQETLQDQQPCDILTPTSDDDSPLQTSIPQTGTTGHTAANGTECGTALKYPTRVSEAPPDDLELALTGEEPKGPLPISLEALSENPDGIWREFTVKLRLCYDRWIAKGFDPYIHRLMEKKGSSCDVKYAFESVLHGLYESAKQLHGSDDAIQAVYRRLSETGCTKICNVMKSFLLPYIK